MQWNQHHISTCDYLNFDFYVAFPGPFKRTMELLWFSVRVTHLHHGDTDVFTPVTSQKLFIPKIEGGQLYVSHANLKKFDCGKRICQRKMLFHCFCTQQSSQFFHAPCVCTSLSVIDMIDARTRLLTGGGGGQFARPQHGDEGGSVPSDHCCDGTFRLGALDSAQVCLSVMSVASCGMYSMLLLICFCLIVQLW